MPCTNTHESAVRFDQLADYVGDERMEEIAGN